MRSRAALFSGLLIMTMAAWAAGPNPNHDASTPTFRVTTAEVNLAFTATDANNQPVTNLAPSDFTLLRDGAPVQSIIQFRSYNDQPLSVLVLTDVSDSMTPGLPMNRAASDWLRQHDTTASDHLSFLDFGLDVGRNSPANSHMTSLFDSLVQTLPTIRHTDSQRPALILLTDGIDTYSFHDLQDVIALAQRDNIAVYAITAHPKRHQYFASDVLQTLCQSTGGKYYQVRETDAMLNAIADIDQELHSGYEVSFRPDASAGMHRLKIDGNNRHVHFYYRSAYYQPSAHDGDLAAGQ